MTIGIKTVGNLGGDFAIGDEVLLYNSKTTNRNIVGLYEMYTIEEIDENVITLDKNVGENFSAGVTQIIKIPHYKNLTIDSNTTVSPVSYNNNYGGIFVVRVEDTLTVNGTIDATGKGYANGYVNPNIQGANGTGKSGTNANDNSGGGGGANQFAGGNGAKTGYTNNNKPGEGNKNPFGNNINYLTQMTFGGAGGNASPRSSANYTPPGTNGGGNILIFAKNINIGTGSIKSNGANYANNNVFNRSAGHGAGGTVKLITDYISGVTNTNLEALGGGGAYTSYTYANNDIFRPSGQNNIGGGGGAGGRNVYGVTGVVGGNATETSGGNGGTGYTAGGGGGGNGYIVIFSKTQNYINALTLPRITLNPKVD